MIRQLVAGGFLRADEHGGLRISQQGQALNQGDLPFTYRVDGAVGRSRPQSVATTTAGPGDAALLAELRTVRLQLARERGVPAFVIFSDRTLIDMTARRPREIDGFAVVHGVGVAKLKDFGELFLNVIARHMSATISL